MLKLDLVTILFQIANFLVLAVVLYFLLFKRVIKQAEKRKEEAESMQQEIVNNLEESRKTRAEADEYFDNIKQKIDDYVEKAKSEIEQNRVRVLEETKNEAEEIYKKRKADALRSQKQTIEKFQREIMDLVLKVSQQTMQLTAPDEIHHLLVKQMNERVWELGKKEMRRVETIRKSLANREEPIVAVKTAKSLSKEEKALIIRTFSALADKNIKLDLKIDESLVSGLRVRLGDFIVDNTLSARLQEISDDTLQRLSERLNQIKIK